MICLVMIQVLGKSILSSEEGAAYVGEVLLVLLSGGKLILWERGFPPVSGGWRKQCWMNQKCEMMVDFRSDWRGDLPNLTNYILCILFYVVKIVSVSFF